MIFAIVHKVSGRVEEYRRGDRARDVLSQFVLENPAPLPAADYSAVDTSWDEVQRLPAGVRWGLGAGGLEQVPEPVAVDSREARLRALETERTWTRTTIAIIVAALLGAGLLQAGDVPAPGPGVTAEE